MLTSIRRSVFAKIACRHSILSIHRNAPVVEQLAGNVGKYKYRYHASSSSASASTTTTTTAAAAAAADEDGNNSNSEDDDATHHYQQPEEHRVCNEQYEGILTIVETPSKGLGLFASTDFEPGELVMSSRPVKTTKERCSHSVQIDWDRHILMNVPCVLINHSCDANVGIRNNNNNNTNTNTNSNSSNNNNNKDGDAYAYDFLAIRPITQGEELTWDYEATEWEISVPFQCGCGSANCRGTLRGFKDSGTMIQQRYGDHYADYLKE